MYILNSLRSAGPRIAIILAVLASSQNIRAQNTGWINPGTGDWFVNGNWNSGLPTALTSTSISNGGTAQILSGTAYSRFGYLGFEVNSSGRVAVDGAGSQWNISGASSLLEIGRSAGSSGNLTISNGGVVNVNSNGVYLGSDSASASGAISISGTGSQLNTTHLRVGNQGAGSLSVSDGGTVNSSLAVTIGGESTAAGSVSLSGVGSSITADQLRVGHNGAGTLGISQGASATSNGAYIGTFGSSRSAAVISGNGSAWSVLQDLAYVGFSTGTEGTLTLSDGGTFGVTNGTGTLYIGFSTGAQGTLNIGDYSGGSTAGTLNANSVVANSGTGTINFNQTNASSISQPVSGNMTVNQRGVGSTTFSGNNTYTGATAVSSGTLLVNGTNTVGNGTTGAYSVTGTGILGGNGTINLSAVNLGVTVASGGALSPGASGAGTLTLTLGTGVLDVSAAVSGSNAGALKFELSSLLSSDKIALTNGGLNIGSGFLNFNDFLFTALVGFNDGSYTLIDTNSTITGTLGSSLSGIIGGKNATIGLSGNGQDLMLNVVPEPSIYALLALGALAIFSAMRCRRANS